MEFTIGYYNNTIVSVLLDMGCIWLFNGRHRKKVGFFIKQDLSSMMRWMYGWRCHPIK